MARVMHPACRVTLGLITLYRDATIRNYTRLRRSQKTLRFSATIPTAEFDVSGTIYALSKRKMRWTVPARKTNRRYVRVTHRSKLLVILDLQGGLCYLCGKPIDTIPTREHVKPRAKNGGSARNILAAHAPCNVRKAHRNPYPCELFYCEIIYELLLT